MKENLHQGHRQRLREEFLSQSANAKFSDYKLLEMLLFYGIPQRDTNELAHELIKTFGSFSAVLEADVTELAKVKNMTRNAACLIKLQLPIAKAYILDKYDDSTSLKSSTELAQYILARYFAVHKEVCSLLLLNNSGRVLAFDVIAEGDIDSVGISIRSIVERILQTNATAVVIAHNHPGGLALPSKQDVTITQAISSALKAVSVRLLDHIIISGDDFVSMADSSEYKELFN